MKFKERFTKPVHNQSSVSFWHWTVFSTSWFRVTRIRRTCTWCVRVGGATGTSGKTTATSCTRTRLICKRGINN